MPNTEAPVVVLLDREFDPSVLSTAPILDVRNVAAAHWEKLLANCRARDLRLYHLTFASLDGIERLHTTTRLCVEWANKITTLRPIFGMPSLETLSVYDLPKLRTLDGIEALQNLKELRLSGNGGSLTPPLQLESLRPVTMLPRLERFALHVARLADDDITHLASIQTLRHLDLSNQFERAQFALLAKRLNAQLDEPITAYVPTAQGCRKCDKPLAMFTGRKQPFLCQSCDRARFDKLTNQFEALVSAA